MRLHRDRRWRRVAPVGVALAMVSGLLVAAAATAPTASAATAASQFHGVNWADPNDNFVTGNLQPVGLSQSDSYSTVYTKATAILKGFQALGANTVRMPFNYATTSGSWWGSYTAAWDAAAALNMNIVVAPWLQGGTIGDQTTFYKMWDTVINKYKGNSHFYFDIMNEPNGYSPQQEDDTAAAWVSHYSSLDRGHIIVPGAYSDNNLCTVGADSRLNGTLLSYHQYSLFGESHTTKAAWTTSFQNNICGYAGRTIMTEFGVPMTTGVNYDNSADGDNNTTYFYALTAAARSMGVGTILWTGVKQANQTTGPGPCGGASCAITSLQGSGTNLSLKVTNQSGLDRLQYSWGGSGGGGGGGTSGVLRGAGSNRCLDVPNQSTANLTQTEIWDCNGGSNQTWTLNSAKELVVYGNKCLDANAEGKTAGTEVIIYDCSGNANQQWTLNSNGTVTNALSGLCLDVTSAGTANGSLVELWTCTGGSNQKWSR